MNVTLEHPTGSILVAYGLGQLADHELLDVDAHLAECDLCRQVVEGVAPDTLLTLLRNAPTDSESTSSRNGCHHPTAATQELAAVPPPPELATHPRYRVGELLGVGGMGAVYKAEHLLMERPVALKVLNPKLLDKPATIERFRREVRAAARLTHPNIVTAFDAEQAGDVHYLVMEYVEGTSLARRSTERGPLPITDACDYIRQAALGLEHAHERGMVHRDIKPHNLMLTPAGQVKILDFGLARFAMESGEADTSLSVEMEPIAAPSEDRRAADLPSPPVLLGRGAGGEGAEPAENSSDHERLIPALSRPSLSSVPGGEGGRNFTGHRSAAIRLTHTGLVMGTPDYIAPEQARDSHLADIRSDIYSLGCTFYELLAGQPPFPDGNALHKVKGHLSRTPQPLDTLRRDVPSELLRIVDRMMAKDPAQRYQGPADVAKALAPFVAAPPKRPRRKSKVALAACAACLLIALAGVIYVQTDRGTIVLETNDDRIAVSIQKNGGVKIVDQATGREYLLDRGNNRLPSGEYQIAVIDPAAGFEFETPRFELKRGKEVRLMAKLAPAVNAIVGSYNSIFSSSVANQSLGHFTIDPNAKDAGPLYLGKPASFWLNQLQDAAPQYRLEALDALGSLAAKNKELVPVIVSVLKDGAGFTRDKETRYIGSVASSILVDLGPDVLPEILKYVDRKSSTALNNAANAIARFGPKAAAAVPLLTQALKTNDLRREAMYALVNIGPAAKPAIPAIIDLLGDALESKEVLESLNERAAIKQDVFGKKGGKGGPASRSSSEGPTWPVVILSSLLNIDPEIKGVLPMEMYIVNPPRRYPQYYGLTFDNGNSEVTSNASVVLWKQTYDILRQQYATQQSNNLPSKQPMTGPASNSAARPASKDEVPMAPMTKWVDSPLGFVEAGPWYLGKPASHWLKQLEDAAPKFRLEAVAALGSISEKNHGVVPSLIASLKDRDLEVATKTSQVLRALGPNVIPDLLNFVDQSSPDALRHAADAIGPIGSKGKAAVPMLIAALRQENWATRRAAADALARIGSEAKPAVPAIVAVLGRALEEKEVIEQIERFAPPAEAKGGGDDPLGKGSSEAPSKVNAGDPFGGKGQGGGGIGKKGAADPNQVFDQLARNRPYFLISEAPPQLRNPLMAFAKDKQLTSEQITRDQFSQFYPNQDQYRALAGAIIRSQAAAGGDPRIQQGGGQGGNPADGLARFAENDFRNRDVNQDNLLNFDEMPKALRDELQRWDVTRDGLINIDEYKAYFAAMAGRNANGGSGGKAKGNFPAGGFNVNSGLPRHMAIELLDDLLLIDPEIKGSLPEGILNAGVLRTRSGINMEAPLALWKQTHEALAKKYPNHPQPFDPFAISPLPQIPNDGGLKQKTAASEPVYKGRPAAFWLEQFKDRDPSTRIEALLALRAIWPKDERIIPVLVTALTDANEKVGSAAVTAFGAYGPGAVPALLGVLKDQSSVLGMSRAATALGRIGQPAKAAIPLLRQALKIDNWNVRRSSIVALGRMGPDAKAALPELVEVFGLSLESQEGVQQQSPESRPSGAHPGWTSFDRREPQRGSPEDINASDA